MQPREQKSNASAFIKRWKNRGKERQDSQSFWLDLLQNVLGIEQPDEAIHFEEKVKLSHDSFIDGYIEKTNVLIEQKGSNKDLDKPIKQSDGTFLTPFQQAQRYSAALPYSKRPRWIVTCNFKEFRVYDMEHPTSEPQVILLKDLAKDYYRLGFMVEKDNQHLEKEQRVSLQAGELVAKLYEGLRKQYKDPDSEHAKKSINQLCVRLVFCLYAEDADLFGKHDMFYDYLADKPVNGIRQALIKLFRVLDTKIEDRDPYLADDDPKLAQFPYVNGGMFRDEDIEIPPFTEELKDLLLNKASLDFDWSDISPTIFGGVFESTLNPETRRQGGMHYTSIENIHKVINPLFLNDLNQELEDIKAMPNASLKVRKAKKFQDKLSQLTFFDPACGSGNFLTETYLCLRRMENQLIPIIYHEKGSDVYNTTLMVDESIKSRIKVSIQQFFGIEINDFAVSVAKTALWIAESQMFQETQKLLIGYDSFLPLHTYTHIHEGNALQIDWNKVIENYGCHYIMGNPPFLGYTQQDKEQKDDLKPLFGKTKNVDYVAGWYAKACQYIQGVRTQVAFVSTNSITQGEQVLSVWQNIMAKYDITLNFAYRSFRWDSDARQKAQVHVVIIGFSNTQYQKQNKYIYDGASVSKAKNINPYLVDMSNIFIQKRSEPLNADIQITKGNQPTDHGNLLLSDDEKQRIVVQDSRTKKFIHPFIGSREFLHNKKRFCFWLVDATPKELRSIPEIHNRIANVKAFREKSSKVATRRIANTPQLFQEIRQPLNGNYLVIPVTTSQNREYIPMGFVTSNTIASNGLLITTNANIYDFGVLESKVHMMWMRLTTGRLKSDYQYSAKIVYNNFPWCNPTDKQKAKIEKTAQAILDARAKYPDSSLADLYDPLTMPVELRKAHEANDRAVMEAYGFDRDASESEIVAKLFEMYEKLTNK